MRPARHSIEAFGSLLSGTEYSKIAFCDLLVREKQSLRAASFCYLRGLPLIELSRTCSDLTLPLEGLENLRGRVVFPATVQPPQRVRVVNCRGSSLHYHTSN